MAVIILLMTSVHTGSIYEQQKIADFKSSNTCLLQKGSPGSSKTQCILRCRREDLLSVIKENVCYCIDNTCTNQVVPSAEKTNGLIIFKAVVDVSVFFKVN